MSYKITDLTPKAAPLGATDLLETSVDLGGSYASRSISGQDIIDACGGKGESYIIVNGSSSDFSVNGQELVAAYNYAVNTTPYSMPLSENNRFTVIVKPGTYRKSSAIVFDTDYINVVSLTGNCDVIIENGIIIQANNNCDFVGLNTLGNSIEIFANDNKYGLNFTNCKAGVGSFGAPDQGFYTLDNCTFTNCTALSNSFGGAILGCTYINCTAGDISFGALRYTSSDNFAVIDNKFINCFAGLDSFLTYYGFGSVNIENNIFQNCTSKSGSFISCIGNFSVTVVGNTFISCKTSDSGSGRQDFISIASDNWRLTSQNITNNNFYDCISENTEGSFISCASYGLNITDNNFYNCQANEKSFVFINLTYDSGEVESMNISNNIFEGCVAVGKSFCHFATPFNVSGSPLSFVENKIYNCKSGQLSFLFASTGIDWIVDINENIVSDCKSFSGESSFIVSLNSKRFTIINNKILNCYSSTERSYFYIYTTSDNSDDMDLRGNQITDCVADGTLSFFYVTADKTPKFKDVIMTNCKASRDWCFGIIDIPAVSYKISDLKFINCVAKNNSFIQTTQPNAIVYAAYSMNCLSDGNSYGNTPISDGIINYCSGTSFTISGTGPWVRLCIDNSQNIINS